MPPKKVLVLHYPQIKPSGVPPLTEEELKARINQNISEFLGRGNDRLASARKDKGEYEEFCSQVVVFGAMYQVLLGKLPPEASMMIHNLTIRVTEDLKQYMGATVPRITH